MTSGYQNSAGTDLDNIFLADNSNGGAINMQISTGQDLGNRYNNGSTLGYAVGFQNSAGTDLGNLRGNYQPGSWWGRWDTQHLYSNTNFSFDESTQDDSQGYVDSVHTRSVYGWFNSGINVTGANATWGLAVRVISGRQAIDVNWTAWANSTADIPKKDLTSAVRVKANKESPPIDLFWGTVGTTPSMNFAFGIKATFISVGGWGTKRNVPVGLRIYQWAGNDKRNSGWVASDFWFG